ncbi:hypothetical protein MNBD_NITROSPIRAE01-422 [hydrothermal vent metagenome]|uniref:PAS domain S-box protein n=1 Tax=hydrothermal vent metagenome TaxID=652676 RepID=A0A3B1D387_9ZZZZ
MSPSIQKTDAFFLKRIQTMMRIRLIMATLFLGLPLLLRLESPSTALTIQTFYFLIGVTYSLSIAYALFLKIKPPSETFVLFQLAVDLLLEIILISVTGGLGSPFPFLLIITIVSAAIFFHHPGGIFMAGASSILFAGMAFFQATRITPFEDTPFLGEKEISYGVFLYSIAFFTVGTLSGRLATRLREKEIGFLDLRVFHEDIVHSMPSGLITTNLDGQITSFNRSATEITGFRSEEVIGKTWWEHFCWQDIQNRFKDLSATGRPQRFEGKMKNPSGETCLLGVTISALRNEQGTQTGIIGTFQDLTEIRNLEEAIHYKERLATIGEMAAGMAHEIRNPLASLSGSIQVLQNELHLSGENIRLMEIAIKESKRLNTFVTQFLRFARPLPPQREWVNLQILLSETVQLLQNNPAYSHQIKIVLEENPKPLLAFVDPDQMKQVFWNLGNNAHQAMETGGTLTLSLRRGQNPHHADEDFLEICFRDTGIGIEESDLSNIFKPFYTTKNMGSGLGLAIVQRIIEEHGGKISVESQDKETTFRVRLPFSSTDVMPYTEEHFENSENDQETENRFEDIDSVHLSTSGIHKENSE